MVGLPKRHVRDRYSDIDVGFTKANGYLNASSLSIELTKVRSATIVFESLVLSLKFFEAFGISCFYPTVLVLPAVSGRFCDSKLACNFSNSCPFV